MSAKAIRFRFHSRTSRSTRGFTAKLRAHFEEQYKLLFGRIIPACEIEVTSWLLLAVAEPKVMEPSRPSAARLDKPKPARTGRLFNPAVSAYREVPVYERKSLEIGHILVGPAIIVEDETSPIVTDGFTVAIDAGGAIRLRRQSPRQESMP